MLKRVPFVPDEYICAQEIAAYSGCSLSWAQKVIKRCPDEWKIKVGRTIYAHGGALVFTRRRGNPHLPYDSHHQSYAATIRWHPEQRQEMRLRMARNTHRR